jgi:hypothetical protein
MRGKQVASRTDKSPGPAGLSGPEPRDDDGTGAHTRPAHRYAGPSCHARADGEVPGDGGALAGSGPDLKSATETVCSETNMCCVMSRALAPVTR